MTSRHVLSHDSRAQSHYPKRPLLRRHGTIGKLRQDYLGFVNVAAGRAGVCLIVVTTGSVRVTVQHFGDLDLFVGNRLEAPASPGEGRLRGLVLLSGRIEVLVYEGQTVSGLRPQAVL